MSRFAEMSAGGKTVFLTVVVSAAVFLWAYAGGAIFLLSQKMNVNDASALTLYQYWTHYGHQKEVQKFLAFSTLAGLIVAVIPLIAMFTPTKRSLFGDARFATPQEIRKAGLLGEVGIIVGRFKGRYLMFAGMQHVLLSAPTRSGKGVSTVIPNLLSWPESVVVLDIKQENWDMTSGYRKKYGQECYLFNPAAKDYRTHRYNPLSYISSDPNFRIDDVQKIANMLYPDQVGTDVIWTATPRSLFVGIVLLLLESPGKPVTLGQVLRESLADGDGSKYFGRVIAERSAAGQPLTGACVRNLNSYISIASDNTRSGVMTSFRSRLELWNNPLVDAATSANDFDLRDVRKKKMSIYIGVTPDNLDRMAPLINLFFEQLVDLNTQELPSQNKALKYTCLLLLDEFTSIGKLRIISKGVSYIAGYKLRLLPIIQSPAQLDEVYGKDAAQTFKTNQALNIVFPPKASETQTARDISEWLGYQTVEGVSVSKARGFGNKTPTESASDQRRALLLPQEITGMKQGTELVVMENVPPILAEKVSYYSDPIFMDRLKEVSPSLRKLGNKLPNQKQLENAAFIDKECGAPVPKLNLEEHNRSVETAEITIVIPDSNNASKVSVREFTADDLPSLSSMALESFAIDFSQITAPTQVDLAGLTEYADQLCKQAGIEPVV